MATRRLILMLLLAVLLFAVIGCTSTSKPSTTGPTTGSATSSPTASAADIESSDETPTVESLKDLTLAEGQESLVFDYLRAGGFRALEARFGTSSATYRTAVDESTTASTERSDGRIYLVQCGIDAGGRMVVMSHSVEALAGQTSTNEDSAFVSAITDGKTTLAEANAYIQKVGGSVERATIVPNTLQVPAQVWNLPDGSGFIVVDLTKLTPAQMQEYDMADAGPWQVLYWTPTHWRAY
jgi:hypothetical protein